MCDWNAKPSENSLSPPMRTCSSSMSTRRPLNDIEPVTAFSEFREEAQAFAANFHVSRRLAAQSQASGLVSREDTSVVDSYIEEFRKVAEN